MVEPLGGAPAPVEPAPGVQMVAPVVGGGGATVVPPPATSGRGSGPAAPSFPFC